jgi:hypothetical protein
VSAFGLGGCKGSVCHGSVRYRPPPRRFSVAAQLPCVGKKPDAPPWHSPARHIRPRLVTSR